MGFFGPPRKAGLSQNELKKKESRLAGIFGFSRTGKQKAEEVERLLEAHMDAEHGGQKNQKVITREELDGALNSLEHDKRISKEEARKIKFTLDKDLRN